MPRLPSVDVIERPAVRPSSSVVGYTPITAQGEAAALGDVGQVIEKVSDQIVTARRTGQVINAMGAATGELQDLEIRLRQDPDFTTAPKRFVTEAEQIMRKHELGIDDSIGKASFARRFGEIALSKRLNVITDSFKREGDSRVAQLDTALDQYATAAANASNPNERAQIITQADLDLTSMEVSRWITAVDAGNRRRAFLGKIDNAIVTRDMTTNPLDTAMRLATDPKYAPAIGAVERERWIDQSFRRSETLRNQAEADAKRIRQERADAGLKDAWDLLAGSRLTLAAVEQLRPDVSAGEYHSLREALKKQGTAADVDDPQSYAGLHSSLYPPGGGPPDVENVRRDATAALRAGKIKPSTFSEVMSKAHSLSRQGGPNSPYERSRALIVSGLEPSPMTNDPAPRARQALAIKEFDDLVLARSRENRPLTEKEMDDAANRVVTKYSLINMRELARATAAATDPKTILDNVARKAQKLIDKKAAKQISDGEFNRQMADLNRVRLSAERALGEQK